jgi:hypothetical protein
MSIAQLKEVLMAEPKDGCVVPAAGPISAEPEPQEKDSPTPTATRRPLMTAKVGKPAPDFEATAYLADGGFDNIKLSSFKGQWVVLCFYPGDFTFV